MCFWVLYDHLARCIALNVVMITVLSVPLWSGLKLAMLPPAGALGIAAAYLWVMAAGQAALLNALLAGDGWRAATFAAGLRRYGFGVLVLGLVLSLAVATSALGIWFYGRVVANTHPLAGLVLAELCACAGAFVLMVAFYAVPALLAQQGKPVRALAISVRLVVRHPLASVALLVTALAFCAVVATPPGFMLLSTWPLVTLACCTYELLARYHGATPPVGDEEDDYLNRGFRDFLFPWKG